MIKITKAILAVMAEVKNIDKNLSVGSGQNTYKGVADKDVKQTIGAAMQKNGLIIIPTGVEPKTTLTEWEETNNYGTKHKTSVLTEVVTKYTLYHESGEFMELAGYGHGVDSQDKSAGKATTYALKNTLLYTFLVPTGAIDDADSTHSDDLPERKAKAEKPVVKTNATQTQIDRINDLLEQKGRSLDAALKHYKISNLSELTQVNAYALIKSLEEKPDAELL